MSLLKNLKTKIVEEAKFIKQWAKNDPADFMVSVCASLGAAGYILDFIYIPKICDVINNHAALIDDLNTRVNELGIRSYHSGMLNAKAIDLLVEELVSKGLIRQDFGPNVLEPLASDEASQSWREIDMLNAAIKSGGNIKITMF